MEIKVLGAGCANCHTLEDRTKEAVQRLGVTAEVEMVTDLGLIAAAGVMNTPALMVDDRVVMTGRVPDVDEIEELIGV